MDWQAGLGPRGPSKGAPLSAGLSGPPLRPSLASAPLPHPPLPTRPLKWSKAAQESLERDVPPHTCFPPIFLHPDFNGLPFFCSF